MPIEVAAHHGPPAPARIPVVADAVPLRPVHVAKLVLHVGPYHAVVVPVRMDVARVPAHVAADGCDATRSPRRGTPWAP